MIEAKKRRGRPPTESLALEDVIPPDDWMPDKLERKFGCVGHMYCTANGYKQIPGAIVPIITERTGTPLRETSQEVLDFLKTQTCWLTTKEISVLMGRRSQHIGYSVATLSNAYLIDHRLVSRTHFYAPFGTPFSPSEQWLADHLQKGHTITC